MRFIKRKGLSLLAFPMVIKGFDNKQAKIWLRKSYHDKKFSSHISRKQRRWAHKHGFLSEYVQNVGITEHNYKDFISERDYLYLQPLNEQYNKWLDDKLSIINVFKPFRDLFPESYYHFYRRYGNFRIIPLDASEHKNENSIEDVMALIKDKKRVALVSTTSWEKQKITYDEEKFYLNDSVISQVDLQKFIFSKNGLKYSMITEYIRPHHAFFDKVTGKTKVLRINIINSEGDNPVIGDAFIIEKNLIAPFSETISTKVKSNVDVVGRNKELGDDQRPIMWESVDLENGSYAYLNDQGKEILEKIPHYETIKDKVSEIGLFVPEIEFMGADVIITEAGFKFEWLTPVPMYPENHPFSQVTTQYLKAKIEEKRAGFEKDKMKRSWLEMGKKLKISMRQAVIRVLFPKGFSNTLLCVAWIKEIFRDFTQNKSSTLKEKMWSYKRGYQSYRLKQYKITPENYEAYISDLEYKWIRHMNETKYRVWFEDKITIKYILSDFKENFPAYYYHVALKNGKNKILPMMDCPKGLGATYEDIFRLSMDKKILALKPDSGSFGKGFFKLTYEAGKFYLNEKETTKEGIREILSDVKNKYLITEYIQMHPTLKEIYPGAVSTLRVIVFKKDGITPRIGDVYMRMGSSKTGGVDNMSAGGMAVEVDRHTGKFFNSRALVDNCVVACEYHPDTGVKIEGVLPNWEKVSAQILKMAEQLPQLEYLGFDVAITENGIKIPEINRSPGFPKIENLSRETMDYLLYKLEMKKKHAGFNGKIPFSIIKLPKRKKRQIPEVGLNEKADETRCK